MDLAAVLPWVQGVTLALTATQGAAILVDEFVYHHRRRLGLFESFGHPVDSAFFAFALMVPWLCAPTPRTLALYAALSLISLVVITKDEWVHAGACEPGEHWLHAVLFVVHAPVLIGIGIIWLTSPDAFLLRTLPLAVIALGFYQLTYWVGTHAWNHWHLAQTGREQRLLRRPWRALVRR